MPRKPGKRGRTRAGHKKPRAKLIMVSVPSSDPARSRNFYKALVGTRFARSLYRKERHYHAPVSSGVQLDLGKPYNDGQPMMAMFAVRSLDRSLERVKKGGGKVVEENLSFPIDPEDRKQLGGPWRKHYGADVPDNLGRGAIAMDPDGNLIALVELEPGAEASFKRGHIADPEFDVHNVSMNRGVKSFDDEDDEDDEDDDD